MNQADRKKIARLHQLHTRNKKTVLSYNSWLTTYFWDYGTQQQINEFLQDPLRRHGPITSISSLHPVLQERTPIHLPYIYRHDLSFEDDSSLVLFQKYNFSWNFISLFTSLTWSYLAQLSPTFRRYHRRYERTVGRPVSLVSPNPRSLWANYNKFLSVLGTSWKADEAVCLGPTWVVLSDVTAVTIAVPGSSDVVGTSVYTHLVNTIHRHRFEKKQFETLGRLLGGTIRSCYSQNVAFIDVGLGNYILDARDVVRFIDGELLQMFPEGVPSHYKALELVLFMETLYLETVRDYCKTIDSGDPEDIHRFIRGLSVFFLSFLTQLSLTNDELALAFKMYHDWSTKASTFYFTFLLSLHRNARVMMSYRTLLRKDLEEILQKFLVTRNSTPENF